MALTNAQRQAKHRATHVKLSAELVNRLHCSLIFARGAAAKIGDWDAIASTHHTESELYAAQGRAEQARASAAMAMYAHANRDEAEGDTISATYWRERARRLTAQD